MMIDLTKFNQLNKLLIFLFLLIYSPFCYLLGDQWYSEYWQKFYWNMWEKEKFSIGTYVKLESCNHLKSYRSIQISEQFGYQATKNFSLEFHYTYIHGHAIEKNSPWKWQHRLEFEGNRIFRLASDNIVTTRNRLEIRRLQNDPKTRYRLRQMTMFVFPFKNLGRLQSFSMYNELFYDFSTYRFNQDRICPAQLTIVLSKAVELNLFILIKILNRNSIWQNSAVFGTQISF